MAEGSFEKTASRRRRFARSLRSINPRTFCDTYVVKSLKSRQIDESMTFLVLVYFPLSPDQLSSRSGSPRRPLGQTFAKGAYKTRSRPQLCFAQYEVMGDPWWFVACRLGAVEPMQGQETRCNRRNLIELDRTASNSIELGRDEKMTQTL